MSADSGAPSWVVVPSSSAKGNDGGSALVETVVVVTVLLVPMVWIALALIKVEAGAYGVRMAAREAARVFVTAPSSGVGAARAQVAAQIAFEDQDVPVGSTALSCSASPCLTPGGTVTARSSTSVPLPFVPGWLAEGAHLGVTVSSEHSETVERYGGSR